MFRKFVPRILKTKVKNLLWFTSDTMDRICGRRDGNTPPTRMMFDGPIGINEFVSGGKDFLELFLSLVKPKPSIKVLDIGSGIGRKTLPLTKYLGKNGSYEGIEIVNKGVVWCQKNITKKFPNFRFSLVDIYNGVYNPTGKINPKYYVLPYPDNFFDVVIATSLFTHMLPEDVKNYHKEIGRVLKKKGKSYITYFIINPESEKRLRDEKNTLRFIKTNKGYWTTHPKTPEIALAYKEKDVKAFYKDADLEIKTVRYGSWSGRENSLSYQDIVISSKL